MHCRSETGVLGMNEENQSTTVLVTGASGYIAMHCILQLLQQGYRVRGTLRSPSREQDLRETFARYVEEADDVDLENRLEFVTADLMSDEGWTEAVDGCRYVLHVASPNLADEPKEEDAWVAPARDGTLRVLRAALDAGVQRVVLTSSIAAIGAGHDTDGRVFTEDDWSNTNVRIGAYNRSKTLAERAAWDFVDNLPDSQALELAVINPSYVIGPILDKRRPLSVEIVGKLLDREVPGVVRIGFPLVDVRDTAQAHLLAMTAPQAAGKRFICDNEFRWFQEIALVLDEHYGDRGYRIPTRLFPNFVARLFALFDDSVKRVVPTLGKRTEVSSERLRSELDWRPRPVDDSIVDTAESLIEFG